MRFTYITISPAQLIGMYVIKGDDDNLDTRNKSATISNSYFTCGDIVLNYNTETGEIISFAGYLPYFDTLPINRKLSIPSKPLAAKLLLGDLNDPGVFDIHSLPLKLSADKTIIHAGKRKSSIYIMLSEDVIIGLKNEQITDIYIQLRKR